MEAVKPPTTTSAALHAAYERRAAEAAPGSDADWRRDHLGASILGHKCDRYLWLSFRWAQPKKLDGRTLRLLERGKREESWLIDDLRQIGVQVWDRDTDSGHTGQQFRVKEQGDQAVVNTFAATRRATSTATLRSRSRFI